MTKASDHMAKKLIMVGPDSTLKEAYDLMLEKKIRHLLITDDKKTLLGILSDRDVKKFASPFIGSPLETERDKATMLLKVGNMMTKDIFTAGQDDALKNCISTMLEKTIDALPVIDQDGVAVGIITTTDLLKLLFAKLN